MITRHNYEELFLLYLDNELSPADRSGVEAFVKENPDLREELEAFRQCRLIPEDESSFGSIAPLLKIARTGRRLFPAPIYRMTKVAAAVLLLLLTGLFVFIKSHTLSSGSQTALLTNPQSGPLTVSRSTSPTAPRFTLPTAPRSTLPTAPRTTLPTAPRTTSPTAPRTTSHTTPQILTSTTQTVSALPRRFAKKDQPPVTPGAHGALYLTTTHQQQDTNKPYDEQIPDETLASTRISLQRRVTLIDPANTRTPEKIIVADNNDGQPDQPYPQSTGSSGTSLAIQTARQDPPTSSAENSSEQVPAGKNKLRGVFRKISRVLEKTMAQNDNDRHAILIGNLQIAL